MNCDACQHPDHAPGPCSACAAGNTTCWQRIIRTGGDGDKTASGRIELATGKEPQPCLMCARWDALGRDRMAAYFLSKGLEVQADGTFKTPIAKDFPNRKSLVLDPSNFGMCRRDVIATDSMATCESWTPTRSLVQLQERLTRR